MTLRLATIVAQTKLVLLDIAYINSDVQALKYLMTPSKAMLTQINFAGNVINDNDACAIATQIISEIPHPEALANPTLTRDEARAIDQAIALATPTALDLRDNKLSNIAQLCLLRTWSKGGRENKNLYLDHNIFVHQLTHHSISLYATPNVTASNTLTVHHFNLSLLIIIPGILLLYILYNFLTAEQPKKYSNAKKSSSTLLKHSRLNSIHINSTPTDQLAKAELTSTEYLPKYYL